MPYTQSVRSLNDKEIRFLKSRVYKLEKKLKPAATIILTQGCIGFGIAAFLCGLGFLTAKDKPPVWFLGILFFLPGLIWTLWFSKDALKEHQWREQTLTRLKDALAYDQARIERITCERMIEIEEREDEGAGYLFEVEPHKLFLLSGQEYYAGPKFPSTDFTLIDILDSKEHAVHSIIEKNGAKLKPYRIISAKDKIKELIPYENKILNCAIEDLEEFLLSSAKQKDINLS